MLKPRCHRRVYFSNIRFHVRTEAPCNWKGADSASLNKICTASAEERVSGHEKKTILYLLDAPNVLHYRRKTLHSVNISEKAIQFWRLGLGKDDLLQTRDYFIPPVYPTGYPYTKIIVSGIPRLYFPETVFDMDKVITDSGHRPMVLPEQRPAAVLQHILKKNTRPRAMVFQTCMGTDPTAQGCLMKPLHRKYTACDSDRACGEKKMPSLLEDFSWQILSENYNTVENADVKNAARLYLQHCKSPRSGVTEMAWKASKGPAAVQCFTSRLT